MNSYKYIDGYENYIIFRTGKVYNVKHKRFIKDTKDKSTGYMRITLCKDGKKKNFSIHRLLGLAFIPNPLNKPIIDHINRIRDDNRLINLRWATVSENNQNKINNVEDLYISKKINKECKQGFNWVFRLNIDGKNKTIKTSVDKEKLIKFRDDYLNSVISLNSESI